MHAQPSRPDFAERKGPNLLRANFRTRVFQQKLHSIVRAANLQRQAAIAPITPKGKTANAA